MRKWMSLLFLISLALQSYAQRNDYVITGKVLDQSTGQPLAGASVFCQNTTLGTITNSQGVFRLQVPSGGYDLAVSYMGFETNSMRVSSELAAQPITIEMKKQDKTMQEVAVVGSTEVKDGWDKYGKFFMDNFIGTTPNASLCELENRDALRFFYSKKRNRLKILTKEDLIITNKALGYKIRYQLDSFVFEYNNNISVFTGYPLFEELAGTDAEKSTWMVNREKAYFGSRLHFMRSWYDSTLSEQGFVLEKITNLQAANGIKIDNPYDSAFYLVDSTNNDTEITLSGRLRITYREEMPDPAYLAAYKLPKFMRVQISAIDVADFFVIEENGYFYEQGNVVNTGYWAWEKIAEALPYDYWPQ
ncbi:MAG TPA: carboxypeptidase-like regulatory domain-containing protein [Chitinophagaceae bacterium]|nr:carboxypeptidase-like regulatory domain-containing protein [Chitinophagaceae bacterium]